jgi:hypothetical protein
MRKCCSLILVSVAGLRLLQGAEPSPRAVVQGNAQTNLSNPQAHDEISSPGYETRPLEGWQVRVSRELLAKEHDSTEKALGLLRLQLAEIVRVVPAPAVIKLREVTLWFSPEYSGVKPTAEYHPGREWLVAHHRNPAMVKGVEFTDVRDFEREMKRMPNFALHELAHAFHDRVLGFDQAEIKAAYDHAKTSTNYDHVERWNGNGRTNTWERAYAMTNEREYFAESTEAFFSRNDFFPFTRDQLEKHDPEMFKLLLRLWNLPGSDKIRKAQ